MTVWPTDCLTDWLTGRLSNCLTNWLRLTDWWMDGWSMHTNLTHFSKPDSCFPRVNFPKNVPLGANGHCNGDRFAGRFQSFCRPFSFINVHQILKSHRWKLLNKVMILSKLIRFDLNFCWGLRHIICVCTEDLNRFLDSAMILALSPKNQYIGGTGKISFQKLQTSQCMRSLAKVPRKVL